MAHAEQGRPGGREKVPCQGTPGRGQDLLSAHIELRSEEHSKQMGGLHDLHHDRSHGVGSVRPDAGPRYKTKSVSYSSYDFVSDSVCVQVWLGFLFCQFAFPPFLAY